MATQATDRLEVVDFMPAVEKLWNDRYRLTFYCRISDKKEDWFGGNVSTFLPAFGELQGANFTGDGWSPRDGEEYSDMRLVEAGAPYISASGEHLVTLVYETISDTFTQEVDDKTNKPKNGLRGVTRKSIAKSGTEYTGEIGVTTIQHQVNQETEITLYLAQVEIEDTDAYRRVTEVWLEAGTLSETLDNVGSQNAKVIETIGADPATPTGYSLASKQESDFEGFQTNRFTFLKNNVILSESKDKVGSQLAIVQEVFNGTPVTPSGYSIANEQVSDFEGIPTRRYTFLKNNAELSRSEDLVGSQLAITTEVFNPTSDPIETGYSVARKEVSDVDGIPTKRFTFLKDNVVLSVSEDKVGSQKAVVDEVFNPTSEAITGIDTSGTALVGYSEANRTESDYEGIKTIRVQFLKPSILSLQQDFNNGLKRVSVQAFGMTSADLSAELAAITNSHELMSQTESDFEGIKTSTFQYQIDETFTEDYELNGLKRISLIELSTTNFTAQDVGAESQTAPTNGLYLGTQSIDNGGIIKARESVWLEAGTLSISKTSESEGVMGVTTQFFGAEGTTVGPIISKGTDNYEGFPVISVKTLQDAAGNSLVNNDENLANSISGFSAFTYPGVIDVNYVSSSTSTNPNAADNVLNIQTLVKKAPAQTKVKTTMYFIFQSSSSITESDYTYASSDGLWSPNHWAGINATASGTADDGEWNDSATFRGYRTSSVSSTATINSTLQNNALLKWQGDVVVSDTTSFTYTSTVDQGPPDPIGNKYTLDVQISPAFDDVGGNKYYKKVITVTDAIPAQPTTASLPYVETP